MINSTNFTPSISANNGLTNSIAPVEKKYVTIDGQQYPVIKVQDNNPMVKSIMPTYKEVVVIDGKQYDINEVSNPLVCDGKKQVVVVDGQQYDVKNQNSLNIEGGLIFNPSTRINPDPTMSYMA